MVPHLPDPDVLILISTSFDPTTLVFNLSFTWCAIPSLRIFEKSWFSGHVGSLTQYNWTLAHSPQWRSLGVIWSDQCHAPNNERAVRPHGSRAFKIEEGPVLNAEGEKTELKVQYNTGFLIAYGISHAVEMIRLDPVGQPIDTGA
jgi:hypothetical protein